MKKEFTKAHGTTVQNQCQIQVIDGIPSSTWFQVNETIFYKDYEKKYFYLVGRCKIEPCTSREIIDFREGLGRADYPYILLEPTEFSFKQITF